MSWEACSARLEDEWPCHCSFSVKGNCSSAVCSLMRAGLPRSWRLRTHSSKSVSDSCHSALEGLNFHFSLHQLLSVEWQMRSASEPCCRTQRVCTGMLSWEVLPHWGMFSSKAGPWFCAGASGWSYCINNYLEISLRHCHNQCRICLCKMKPWCCATHQNKDTVKSEREARCPLMLLGWFTLSASWNCTNSSYKQGKVIVMEILGINQCSVKLKWFWFPVAGIFVWDINIYWDW